jgi:hypothetical protein
MMHIKVNENHCLFVDYTDLDNIVIYPLSTPNSTEFPKNNFYQVFQTIFRLNNKLFLPFHDLPFVDMKKMLIEYPQTHQGVFQDYHLNMDGSLMIATTKGIHYFQGHLKIHTCPSIQRYNKYVCNHYIVVKESTEFTIYHLFTSALILTLKRIDDFVCDVLTLTQSHFWLRTFARSEYIYYLVDVKKRRFHLFKEKRIPASRSKVEQKSDSLVAVHYYDESEFSVFEIDFNLISWQ